ncbi:pentapeptide repeat-containing protein [Nocardia sp. NPDC006630]|uniref:pentapeptide repeat-containing protein n=1 Tax=Nocardia sp. NPDC006630 TaxID=3157181 RepID=UPI0033AD9B9B
MADRKYGEPAPPTTSTIRGADWYGRTLRAEQYRRVEFLDVDMAEITTENTVFDECSFRGVAFNLSAHTNSGFLNCTFSACSFFDATFTSCKLTGSMFDGCTYSLLKASGGDWSFAGLPGADLRGTSFRELRMREVDLTGARCQKATFRDIDLSGAWLTKADFSDSDLRGSDISALDPYNVQVARAVIDPDQAITLAFTLGLKVLPA